MTISKTISNLVGNFLFPEICVACEKTLPHRGEELCLECQLVIPKTNFHNKKENLTTERLAGRFPFRYATSYYFYTKTKHTQNLIFSFKYHGKRDIGIFIGETYGRLLYETPFFHDINGIVPVPMHPSKVRLRGYNQAEVFAEGLASTMESVVFPNALKKIRTTQSQTQLNHGERWSNVQEIFELGEQATLLKGRHILLVDDVLTTGATLDTCANELLKIEGIQISVATIAIAT
jgi:ComF family protein